MAAEKLELPTLNCRPHWVSLTHCFLTVEWKSWEVCSLPTQKPPLLLFVSDVLTQHFFVRWRGLVWRLVLLCCQHRGVTACPGSVDKCGSWFYVHWLWRCPACLQPLIPSIELGSTGRISEKFCVQGMFSLLFNPTVVLNGLAGFGAPEWENDRRTSRIQSGIWFSAVFLIWLWKISTQFSEM